MFKKILSNLFILVSLFLNAQEVDWYYNIENSSNHKGILIDEQDNVYVLGSFYNSIQIDSNNIINSSFGNTSNYMLKYNSNGNLVFAKELDFGYSVLQKICFDNDYNIIAVCKQEGFEFEAISLNKIDTLGNNLISSGIIGSLSYTGKDIYVTDVKVDSSNNLITTGNYSGNVGHSYLTPLQITNSTDIFIAKNKSNGDVDWVKSIASNDNDFISSVEIGNDNDLYFTGNFRSIADFDPGIDTFLLNSVGGADIFILKLDSNGNFIWVEQFGGTNDDGAQDILLKENGSYLLAGGFQDKILFNNDSIVSKGNYDGFLIELSNNFDLEWSHTIGGDSYDFIFQIENDNNGNIYALSLYDDSLILNNNQIYSNGTFDNIFQKLDEQGSIISTTFFGGNNSVYDFNEGNTIFALDKYQNPHFIGLSKDTFKLNAPQHNFQFVAQGTNNAYFFKIDTRDYTSIRKIEESELNHYPNPSKSYIYFESDIVLKQSIISIFDIQGKQVFKQVIHQNYIDIETLTNGVYFYTLESNNKIFSGKIMKK